MEGGKQLLQLFWGWHTFHFGPPSWSSLSLGWGHDWDPVAVLYREVFGGIQPMDPRMQGVSNTIILASLWHRYALS